MWSLINSSAPIGGKFIFTKNPLQDLLSSLNAVISTNESTQFITGDVIYNPAYTYKFQLKTTKETNGNTLEISLAEEEDAGDYFCQVSTYNPIQIKHSVRKLKVHELILIEFAMWIYPIQIAERSNGLQIPL